MSDELHESAWLSCLREQAEGVWISVKVQPRSPRNEITGPVANELKVKVTAPPVDSAANEVLVRYLAEVLDCPRGAVQLVRGQTARHKVVCVNGISAVEMVEKLRAAT
ncbi:MAG: DUF167 domain-containing protein [Verrucomicrobiota bacterium]